MADLRQYAHLYRGVFPFLFEQDKPDYSKVNWQEDVDNRLKWGIKEAVRMGIIDYENKVVCVQGWRGGRGNTNTIRIVPAKEDLGLDSK